MTERPDYPRARQARALRAKGLEREAIAERMGIKPKTVTTYLVGISDRRWKRWTKKREEKLISLYLTGGINRRSIALELNTTFNAITGKLARLRRQGRLPKHRKKSTL